MFKPEFYENQQFVYSEGEVIEDIYFLHKGEALFVLPIVNNYPYIKVEEEDHFGIIDIVGYQLQHDKGDLENWWANRNDMKRFFSVQAKTYLECVKLSLPSFN